MSLSIVVVLTLCIDHLQEGEDDRLHGKDDPEFRKFQLTSRSFSFHFVQVLYFAYDDVINLPKESICLLFTNK